MRGVVILGVILIAFGLVCPAASGKEAQSEKNWEFELAPLYLWAVSLNGDLTVKGRQVDFDVSFSEIFDNLNGAVTFHFDPDENTIFFWPFGLALRDNLFAGKC
jgi:hypothetical protein